MPPGQIAGKLVFLRGEVRPSSPLETDRETPHSSPTSAQRITLPPVLTPVSRTFTHTRLLSLARSIVPRQLLPNVPANPPQVVRLEAEEVLRDAQSNATRGT